jgi:5-methylthioadenosine/S-adenosylhomocysteine deaminase
VPAIEALRMATINGARALGIADRCGSLEAGKAVDMIAVDLSALHFAPMYDVVSHLVYVADRQSVNNVWIGGRQVLADGQLTTIDEANVLATAAQWQGKIMQFKVEQSAK